MGYKFSLLRPLWLSLALTGVAACSHPVDVEKSEVELRDGSTVAACLDVELDNSHLGYLDIAALPDLSKTTLSTLAIDKEEAERLGVNSILFSDSNSTEFKGVHTGANSYRHVTNCGKDPREEGLTRYTFGGSDFADFPDVARYHVYYDDAGQARVIEGWVRHWENRHPDPSGESAEDAARIRGWRAQQEEARLEGERARAEGRVEAVHALKLRQLKQSE